MTLRLVLPITLVLLVGCSSDDASSTTEATTPVTTEAATGAPPPPPAVSSAVDTAPSTTAPATEAPATTAPPTTASATVAPTTAAPPTTEPGPAFTTIAPGEYDVGVTTVTLDDPDRPLTVDIWFPLADDAQGLTPHQYTLLPGVYYESPEAFSATAEQLADGPFPLVIYSHGSGGLRYIHSAFTEALASHGYVVAAADHTGNTAVDTLLAGTDAVPDATTEPTEEQVVQWQQIGLDRTDDVTRLIDAMTDPSSTTGPFAADVDTDRIAVAGHSAGGATATAMAIGISNEIGTFPPDERVDAIVLLAPALGGFTDDELAAVDLPTMTIVGTADRLTPAEPNGTRLWSVTDQSPAYRIELEDAGHYAFTDICAYQAALPTLTDVPQPVAELIGTYAEYGCAPDNMAPERTNELTETYVGAFLDEAFHDGPSVLEATGTPPVDVTLFDAR